MQRGKLIAIAVGIAVAVALGAVFAFNSATQGEQKSIEPTGTDEGRDIVVNIEEKLQVSENP